MKESITVKLEALCDRFDELSALLSEETTLNQPDSYRLFSKEYAELNPVVTLFKTYTKVLNEVKSLNNMLHDSDSGIRELAQEELQINEKNLRRLEIDLQQSLISKDPNDDKSVFLEIRAGTGGDEAAIFSGDLFRMYSKYSERHRWKVEIVSAHEGDHGGFKEVIARISGKDVYSKLKFESGAHRVQRVPETESQGRVHTSTCTVAILAELDERDAVEISKSDLRIDTFRASGSGGQHVNKTDSAIRLTHIPTGFVVECQDERSQHKNRAKAMAVLQARLSAAQNDALIREEDEKRRILVGSGDRSERIRTYNFPQGRLTDHRINLTLYKLLEIVDGDLEEIVQELTNDFQASQLSKIAE